jgi:hypothetical protein
MKMERNELVERLFQEIENGSITEKRQLYCKFDDIYTDICGNRGKEEFKRYVLSATSRVYDGNLTGMANEAMRIIREGACLHSRQIGEYYRFAGRKIRSKYFDKGVLEEYQRYQAEHKKWGMVFTTRGLMKANPKLARAMRRAGLWKFVPKPMN